MAATQSIDVVMPQMGVSVSEGTITKWLKQEGDPVAADESLLEISTDKVDTEVPSPGSGVVQQILVQEGDTVEVGTKLAVIAPEGAAPAEEAPAPAEEAPAPAEEAPAPAEEAPAPAEEAPAPPEPATHEAASETAAPSSSEGETPAPEGAPPAPPTEAPAPAAPPEPAVADGDGAGERTFVSPVVARIASEHGVDVSQVSGTGRGGRVTKKDILAFVESGGAQQQEQPAAPVQPEPQPQPEQQIAPAPPAEPAAAQAPPPPPAPPAPAAALPQPQPVAQAAPEAGETVEPVNAMRRGIAEHMRRSLDTSAHVTSAIEVDMSNVVSIRKKLKGEYQRSYGVNPTYLSFIARAAVETLRDYPWINGELRGDQIVTRNYVNLGFAVELADGKGLIVPVVKHAEGLNLLGMARSVSEIAQRARDKKLLPDDVQGGTFTITNPGGYGTFHGTPVISQPQAAILGTYAVVKRPWVIQDDRGEDVIAIRPIMNLTLTYDHRLVDGALAGRFLRDLRERLETWGEENY
jgi:pyruvate dehydrogenase E2 component (dihydrolipoamide acetyltransferase)